ncbi:MAG: type II toxin-antitoxin system RelE/ParE family toxin [Candidatus Acidiferrum sp.]
MRVRWSAAAADDLENITEYLFEKTPQHAARLVRSLYGAVSSLKTYPNRGRPGKKPGTRELVVQSSPSIVVYQVSADVVYVARILHGAQKWPE